MNKRLIIAGLCSIALVLSLVVIAAAQAVPSEPESRPISKAVPAASGVDWMQMNENGFGNPSNSDVMSLEVFGGQLYAGTYNWNEGGRVWRTSNGSAWTAVSDPGFGTAYTTTNRGLLDMIEFNGLLYVGTGRGWEANTPGQIWRSSNGTDWTQVEDAGFDDPGNVAIATLAVFNNQLYAATQSWNGLEIWRSSTGNSGEWSRVVAGGNGNWRNSTGTGLMEFNGYLYAAVENGTDGVEIWRTDNGATWSTVSSGGFGSTGNIETGGFAILDGYLYIGTRNDTTGGQIWRSNNGTGWAPVVGNGFGDPNNLKIESLKNYHGVLYAGTDNNVTGIELWRSYNGTTWTQISADGFGNSLNTGMLWSAGTVIFNDDLYIGTTNNTSGGEVWATVKPLGTWSAVTSSVTSSLRSVSMLSANEGWAVGYQGYYPNGNPQGSVILRRNGNTWNEWGSDSSGPALFSVTTLSDSDSWAVGSNSSNWSAIRRWNGSDWNSVTYTGSYTLKSVAMVSADEGWAVGGGGGCNDGNPLIGTLMHWNGSAWSLAGSLPNEVLSSVAMVSASDGWAVGYYCHFSWVNNNGIPMPNWDTDSVIMHWDGSTWNEVSSPTSVSLNSVAMLSATDGWVVGYHEILHWNGSAWSWVSSPTLCDLRSVSMVSADDGWAVGGGGGNCPSQPSVILHWDGNTWSEASSPVPATLNSVAMISANEGWAVGEAGTILHYTNWMDLGVSKTGTGNGTVTSSPAGIDCGATCSTSFDYNTSVTLTATATTGSTFTGWSGDAPGTTNPITMTLDAARSVTASFTLNTYALSISKTGTGSGTVTSTPPGIDCGATCSTSFDYNTSVTLTATAATGSTFTGWSGEATGTTNPITVTISANKIITATFTLVSAPTITGFAPTSGPVGKSVTITGTNFTGATAVMFNGASASNFHVLSSTSLTATVPTLAATGPISVTTSGGTAMSSSNFTVLDHTVYLPLILR